MVSAAPSGPVADVTPLTPEELAPIAAGAIRRWSASHTIPADAVARLADVQFQITALPASTLGREIGGTTVEISPTAAGFGWFIDTTPLDDSEFPLRSDGGARLSADSGPAAGRIDLLTVVMHELGHALGLNDLDTDYHPDDLMDDMLVPGVRRLPVIPDALAEGLMAHPASTPEDLRPLALRRPAAIPVPSTPAETKDTTPLNLLSAPSGGTTIIGVSSLGLGQPRHLDRRRPGKLQHSAPSSQRPHPSLVLGQHHPVGHAHSLPAGPNALRLGDRGLRRLTSSHGRN
jgi:hypothetical protein